MGYYVVGAEYLDVRHTQVKPGTAERHGPFATYEEAVKKWRERAVATVDDYYIRFTIVSEDGRAASAA